MTPPTKTISPWASVLFLLSILTVEATFAVERLEEGNRVTESIPPIPAEVGERLRQYQNTRSAGLVGWVALGEDGYGLMISTRFGETGQLHVVDHPGGTRRQITFFDEPVAGASLSPNGRSVLLTKDIGGNEFYQVYSLDPSTGRSALLTDGESRHGAVQFTNDGARYAYYTTARNGRDWDIHLADLATGEDRAILEREGTWFPYDFDPTDEKLLVGQYVSITESRALAIDLATGLSTPIAPSEEATSIGQAMWTANGRVLLTSDADSEVRRLRLYDPVTGGERTLSDDIAWDVTGMALDPKRERLAFVVNEDGIDRLYLLDLATLTRQAITQLPTGTVDNMVFDPTGQRLALQINTAKSPSDVYVLALASGQVTQWTFSEVGGLDPEGFVAPRLVRFPTFDKVGDSPRTIPAFYYRPPGDGPFPVLISIHGGPEGQYRPRFSSTFQYFVNELGMAVVAPNVRGSSGYGKTYVKLDNGYLREDSVKDIGALLDWVAAQPELDSARVAVRGGSYGGYMSLASMIHYNDRLACGVDVVGISNFVTFLENTKPYRQDLRRPEYGDERDPKMRAFLERISPTARAQEITRPMYIAQGLNDPRVPASESEQMLERIRSNGQEVWYFLAKDEGHGFKKKRNRDFYLASQAYFLERCLLGSASSAQAAR
ncbi:MAG: prolyl oligopeptidase family serine peptidase [Pseudomonadota bacterium]